MAVVNIKIPLINEEEVFNKLPDATCDRYHLSHSRYLFSNCMRIFDTTTEKIILGYPGKQPYYLIKNLSNIITYIPLREVINNEIASFKGSRLNDMARIFLDHMVLKKKSISETCILDRELVMYIRSNYFSKDMSAEEIKKQLSISSFSLNFAVGENFVKFENSCEVRENDINLALQFMEAVVTITTKNPGLGMKTVCRKICDKMGIEMTTKLYNKTFKFYSGRNSYIYIPKNVQRLVDKT